MRKTLLVLFTISTIGVAAQEKTHREWFAEAVAAAEAGNLAVYASSMAEALEANTVPSNRPFMLYHLARARVMLGDSAGSLEALRSIWDEDIERLLVFYVEHDPAFEELRETEGWQEIASGVASLELTMEELRDGLYIIEGAGSSILAKRGEEGWLLVDSGYAQASIAIRNALDTVSSQPVVVVINTHEHEDHVGGNERFGGSAIVVAHTRALEVLSTEQEFIPGVNLPPKPDSALPNILTEESLIVPFGEERAHVVAIPAHSGSDLAVLFEEGNVIHMGDGFFPGQSERIFPGKDPETFLARLASLLERSDEETVVVTSHAGTVPVATLRDAVGKTAAIWNWTVTQTGNGLRGDALATAATEAGHPIDWVEYFEDLLRDGVEED